MKWCEILGTHINMNLVASFVWYDGKLRLWFVGDSGDGATLADPDRELYIKMCRSQGIRPYEEGDADG